MSDRGRQPGDERLQRWVGEHGPALRGYLLGVVRRTDVADDLVQETFCRAWKARGDYVETGSARSYLLRIADRLAVDHFRQRGRETNCDDDRWNQIQPTDTAPEPEAALAAREAQRQLAAALDSLTQAQRRVLLLRYYGDMPFAEIAAATGWALGTVLSHCHRGLAALRKLLVENPR